jgi:hypothetical protein
MEITTHALKGFEVGDADVLEHVGVAGDDQRWCCGEREQDDDGEGGGELVRHGSRDETYDRLLLVAS